MIFDGPVHLRSQAAKMVVYHPLNDFFVGKSRLCPARELSEHRRVAPLPSHPLVGERDKLNQMKQTKQTF